MTKKDILNLVRSALRCLYVKDLELLQSDVSERAIAHKLAEYIQIQQVVVDNEYRVDCEYNRHGIAPKTMCDDLNVQFVELAKNLQNVPDSIRRKIWLSLIFPDVIVHKRGKDEDNLCAIELKKNDPVLRERKRDDIKLKCYTSKYQYQLGLAISVNTGEGADHAVVDVEIYQNGEKLENESEAWKIST